jgi:hypothetical protein
MLFTIGKDTVTLSIITTTSKVERNTKNMETKSTSKSACENNTMDRLGHHHDHNLPFSHQESLTRNDTLPVTFFTHSGRRRETGCSMFIVTLVTLSILSTFLILSLNVSGVDSSPALGWRVCDSRELKELQERICSSFGKRDILPFMSALRRSRIRRMSASDLAVSCCQQPCPLTYYSLFCEY